VMFATAKTEGVCFTFSEKDEEGHQKRDASL